MVTDNALSDLVNKELINMKLAVCCTFPEQKPQFFVK